MRELTAFYRHLRCIEHCAKSASRLVLLCFLLSGSTVTGLKIPFRTKPATYDYDLIIIGAGASGLFAAGAATSLGSKTLLIDHADGYVGGDCSNAACVPSKAVRSVARMASTTTPRKNSSTSWLSLAREHALDTVMAVRQREDPVEMTHRNPNLDLVFCKNCTFTSPHVMELTLRNSSAWNASLTSDVAVISSKQFLIATGASPIVPQHLKVAAREAGVPVFTYRTVLEPPTSESSPSIWTLLKKKNSNLVIVGGGPSACELGQSFARLGVNVTIVAPEVLPKEDVTLRRAAMQLLTHDGITLCLNSRVDNVRRGDDSVGYVEVNGGKRSIPADALLLCVGRSPGPSLATLNLQAAGVSWDPKDGVEVCSSSLRSKSASHVFACGDCCDAVHDKGRRAAHAAWTGFHAARNTVLPVWLRAGSRAVHPAVPGVVYTDPELASVGLSHAECVRRYGLGGFDCLCVQEEGMDRADMDRLERTMFGFVELRATKVTGKLLGLTACGPAAAELANEAGLAILSRLTVRDMARAIHSYPSHGYLMHRIALALATNNVWGLLSACGPAGKVLGSLGRLSLRFSSLIKSPRIWRASQTKRVREWEATGTKEAILVGAHDGVVRKGTMDGGKVRLFSYHEVCSNERLLSETATANRDRSSDEQPQDLVSWIEERPK